MLCYTRFQSFLQGPERPVFPVRPSPLARDCAENLPVAELLELVEDGGPVVLDQHAICGYVEVARTEVVHDPLVNRAGDGDGPSL